MVEIIDSNAERTIIHWNTVSKISSRPDTVTYRKLKTDPEVFWFQQQIGYKHKNHERQKQNVSLVNNDRFENENAGSNEFVAPTAESEFEKYRDRFNDPAYQQQWHLFGSAEYNHSMNIQKAWDLGYTGRYI